MTADIRGGCRERSAEFEVTYQPPPPPPQVPLPTTALCGIPAAAQISGAGAAVWSGWGVGGMGLNKAANASVSRG